MPSQGNNLVLLNATFSFCTLGYTQVGIYYGYMQWVGYWKLWSSGNANLRLDTILTNCLPFCAYDKNTPYGYCDMSLSGCYPSTFYFGTGRLTYANIYY